MVDRDHMGRFREVVLLESVDLTHDPLLGVGAS